VEHAGHEQARLLRVTRSSRFLRDLIWYLRCLLPGNKTRNPM